MYDTYSLCGDYLCGSRTSSLQLFVRQS